MQKYKTAVALSPQQTISCSNTAQYNNNGCTGGLINTALNYVADNGLYTLASIPYVESNWDGEAPAACTASTATGINVKVTNVTEVGNQSLLSLLNALQTAPVAIAIAVPNALYSYSSGLFSASNCPASNGVNHAVLAVGYSLTGDSTTGNKPYLLIKNSWGSSWGENGYFKLDMPLVDAGSGSCMITVGGYNYTASLA